MDQPPSPLPPPPPAFPQPPPPDWGQPQHRGFYPLDVGRVIQLTFSLFRFRWRVFLGISLSVLIPVNIAQALLQVATVDAITRWTREVVLSVSRGDVYAAEMLALIPFPAIALSYVASAIVALVSLLAVAGITHATASSFVGGRTTIGGSLRAAFAKFGAAAVVFLVPFLLVLGLVFACGAIVIALVLVSITNGAVQPGIAIFAALVVVVALFAILIFLTIRWAFAVAALMIEDLGGLGALGRSWRLVAGSGWRVLGYFLLLGVLIGLPFGVIAYIITTLVGPAYEQTAVGIVADPFQTFLSTFLLGIIAALFAPLTTIAMTILYFDVRARRGERVPVPGEAPPAQSSATAPTV